MFHSTFNNYDKFKYEKLSNFNELNKKYLYFTNLKNASNF